MCKSNERGERLQAYDTIYWMISSVVLTHDNEGTIGKTLQSLLWCDERIVVDDYSNDRTVAIATKYRVKIIKHHLNRNFATQRNFGLTHAKGDWVLFVDSDEIVSKALEEEIRKALNNPEVSGYVLRRKDFMFGRPLIHGETANVRLLRLARRSAGRWERSVHEVWSVKGATKTLVHPLLHFPHQNIAQFLNEINTYSTLNAQYFYDHNVHSSSWQIVAYPTAKFLLNYIWRLGFLDGTPGIMVAVMMSFHSFLTRAKLYMLWRKSKQID